MGSGRGGVHEGGSDGPVVVSHVVLVLDLVVRPHWDLGQPLDEHAHRRALAHLQSSLWSVIRVAEEVLDVLVVDFQHADRDLELYVRIRVFQLLVYAREYLFAGPRHDPLVGAVPDDRVALPRPGLPVCEQTRVVSLKRVVDDIESLLRFGYSRKIASYHVLKHQSLIRVRRIWRVAHMLAIGLLLAPTEARRSGDSTLRTTSTNSRK